MIEGLLFVDQPEKLTELKKLWPTPRALGFDTEFQRERTYLAELALVQISDGTDTVLLDPTRVELKGVFEWLDLTDHTYIFHSPSQDLEILEQCYGWIPKSFVDTQVASMLLGYPNQISLANLLFEELGIQLEKSQTVSKWLRRPLTQDQIFYACEDVIYLPKLLEKLDKKLRDAQKITYFEEECRFENFVRKPIDILCDRHLSESDSPYYSEITRRFLMWREELAARRNLPRGWLLKDKTLLKAARSDPDKWLEDGILTPKEHQHYAKILENFRLECSASLKRPLRLSRPLRDRCSQLTATLKQRVQQIASEQQIAPEFLSNQKTLQKISLDHLTEKPYRSPYQTWRAKLLDQELTLILKAFTPPSES